MPPRSTLAQINPARHPLRDTELAKVRKLLLFSDIDPAHFQTLVAGAFLQRFPGRTELVREGDVPDFLHIVVEGTVELFGCLDERETALTVLGPNATFVLAAGVHDEAYLTSARTLASARILMIPAAAVRAVFDTDAAFARATVRELARRYRDAVRDLKSNKLRTGHERLANYLLRLNTAAHTKGAIELPVEKRTLASYPGMAPENLSRALAQLAEHGAVMSGQTVTITGKAKLRKLANPHPLIDSPDP